MWKLHWTSFRTALWRWSNQKLRESESLGLNDKIIIHYPKNWYIHNNWNSTVSPSFNNYGWAAFFKLQLSSTEPEWTTRTMNNRQSTEDDLIKDQKCSEINVIYCLKTRYINTFFNSKRQSTEYELIKARKLKKTIKNLFIDQKLEISIEIWPIKFKQLLLIFIFRFMTFFRENYDWTSDKSQRWSIRSSCYSF